MKIKSFIKYHYLLLVIFFIPLSFVAQNSDCDAVNKKKGIVRYEIVFDSNDPDAGLYSFKDEFKEQHIVIKISNIKRNSYQKIIAIDIEMKSETGKTQSLHINREQPIKAISLFADINGKTEWDFGIKELDAEIVYQN